MQLCTKNDGFMNVFYYVLDEERAFINCSSAICGLLDIFFLKKNLPFQKKDREMHAKLLDNNGRLNLFVWVVGA